MPTQTHATRAVVTSLFTA